MRLIFLIFFISILSVPLAHAIGTALGYPSGQALTVCVPSDTSAKCGPNAANGGSVLGHALTINCDNVCILCSLSGSVETVSFNPSCSSGPPPSFYVSYLNVTASYLGVKVTYLGR